MSDALEKEAGAVILFYAAQNNQVVASLERQLTGYRVARYCTCSTMEKRLRKPRHGLEIALVVVNDLKEMGAIEALQSLMRDLRLVLVLPGRDAIIVAQAHKMAPRFIAYADHGFDQIGAVMKKMTRGFRNKMAAPVVAPADHG